MYIKIYCMVKIMKVFRKILDEKIFFGNSTNFPNSVPRARSTDWEGKARSKTTFPLRPMSRRYQYILLNKYICINHPIAVKLEFCVTISDTNIWWVVSFILDTFLWCLKNYFLTDWVMIFLILADPGEARAALQTPSELIHLVTHSYFSSPGLPALPSQIGKR